MLWKFSIMLSWMPSNWCKYSWNLNPMEHSESRNKLWILALNALIRIGIVGHYDYWTMIDWWFYFVFRWLWRRRPVSRLWRTPWTSCSTRSKKAIIYLEWKYRIHTISNLRSRNNNSDPDPTVGLHRKFTFRQGCACRSAFIFCGSGYSCFKRIRFQLIF